MRCLLSALLLCASPAFAQSPKVATDIAPIHSLVATVMQGVADPTLIVPPGASPHHYAMRPSEARALAQSDLVIWVGHGLTPWLERPLENLAQGAQVIELSEVAGTLHLEMREGGVFDDHDHDHGHDDAEEGAHATDPHMWLDPDNAKLWLDEIAAALAGIDAENAETYRANAKAGQAHIDEVAAAIAQNLSNLQGAKFVLLHDGFHYFEAHFEVEAFAAIASSDAETPGPARVANLRDELAEAGISCAFSEPQIDASLLATVTEGLDINTGILDPIGADISLGSAHYGALLTSISDSMITCMSK